MFRWVLFRRVKLQRTATIIKGEVAILSNCAHGLLLEKSGILIRHVVCVKKLERWILKGVNRNV